MINHLLAKKDIAGRGKPSPPLPSFLEQQVERIWHAVRVERGSALFNGPLFSLEEIYAHTVTGRFVDYRLFLAQEHWPELFAGLRVQPLAASGLLQNAEEIFFGYRSSAVAFQADCWELINPLRRKRSFDRNGSGPD